MEVGSGKWVWKVDGEEETDVELNRMVIAVSGVENQ